MKKENKSPRVRTRSFHKVSQAEYIVRKFSSKLSILLIKYFKHSKVIINHRHCLIIILIIQNSDQVVKSNKPSTDVPEAVGPKGGIRPAKKDVT